MHKVVFLCFYIVVPTVRVQKSHSSNLTRLRQMLSSSPRATPNQSPAPAPPTKSLRATPAFETHMLTLEDRGTFATNPDR